ncbi:MAG: HDIG domain-containing protein [Peptostreptococcaceae bacterium]|nr:HDIG domain-containing protein [Peptostreptococcaceae bacterium]
MSYITKEYAMELLENNQTPEHVILHCMEVARVSEILAGELNKHGYNLSLKVVKGAAMLHDISRVDENHGEVGARIAESKGYQREADIIKNHMHYSITNDIRNLSEMDIVCLGDRMVKEDEYVGLRLRMDYILNKFKNNPKAEEIIKTRILENGILLKKIEKLIGNNIDDLMIEKGNE